MARKKKKAKKVEKPEEQVVSEESKDESVQIEDPIPQPPEVKTVELVYLGTAEKATVRGAVTGVKYEFFKDSYNMPSPTVVDEKDSSAILALIGKACCGKKPQQLFMKKVDWDLDLESAKQVNR
jgi:hypothetical protein